MSVCLCVFELRIHDRKIVRIVRGYSRVDRLCVCVYVIYVSQVAKNSKHYKRNLRVWVDRVCVTYVDKVGINCKNCKRNWGGGPDQSKCVSHMS